MKDKLLELIGNVQHEGRVYDDINEVAYRIENSQLVEHLLQNGVLVPPCKIGDTVYIIDEAGDGECSEDYVLDVKVQQFFINEHGIAVDLKLPLGMRCNTWMVVGKNVFLTEEEAEKALAKLKGGAE